MKIKKISRSLLNGRSRMFTCWRAPRRCVAAKLAGVDGSAEFRSLSIWCRNSDSLSLSLSSEKYGIVFLPRIVYPKHLPYTPLFRGLYCSHSPSTTSVSTPRTSFTTRPRHLFKSEIRPQGHKTLTPPPRPPLQEDQQPFAVLGRNSSHTKAVGGCIWAFWHKAELKQTAHWQTTVQHATMAYMCRSSFAKEANQISCPCRLDF